MLGMYQGWILLNSKNGIKNILSNTSTDTEKFQMKGYHVAPKREGNATDSISQFSHFMPLFSKA